MAISLKKRPIVVSVLTLTGCTVPADKNGDIKFMGNQSPTKVYPRIEISTKFAKKHRLEKIKIGLKCVVCDSKLWSQLFSVSEYDYYESLDYIRSDRPVKAVKYDEHYLLFCHEKTCEKIYTMAPFSYDDKVEKSKRIDIPNEIDVIV